MSQTTGQLKSIVLIYADNATMDTVVELQDDSILIARESGNAWKKSIPGPLADLILELDALIRDQAGIPALESMSSVKDPREAKRLAGSGDGSWQK